MHILESIWKNYFKNIKYINFIIFPNKIFSLIILCTLYNWKKFDNNIFFYFFDLYNIIDGKCESCLYNKEGTNHSAPRSFETAGLTFNIYIFGIPNDVRAL